MRLYRDTAGVFHRTQADAKASGLAWDLVEVPTDHAGLSLFLTALIAGHNRAAEPAPEPMPASEWRNGMPSPPPFMGSRHPEARSICLACGRTPFQAARAVERGLV